MAYHHGDLRATLLQQAAATIAEGGVGSVTLRSLARSAGVSHAAPSHHFGDLRGLFTALATEGFIQLAAVMQAAPTFLDAAVAYVRFATGPGRGHYAVMFDPSRIDTADPDLVAARAASEDVLLAGIRTVEPRTPDAPLAAFALVHGLVTLYDSGTLERQYPGADAATLVRRIAPLLFTETSGAPPRP